MPFLKPNPSQFADLAKYESFHSARQRAIDRQAIRAFFEGTLIRMSRQGEPEVVTDKFYFPSLTRLDEAYSDDGSFKSYEITGGWLSVTGAARLVNQWDRDEQKRQELLSQTAETYTEEQIRQEHPYRHLGQMELTATQV